MQSLHCMYLCQFTMYNDNHFKSEKLNNDPIEFSVRGTRRKIKSSLDFKGADSLIRITNKLNRA